MIFSFSGSKIRKDTLSIGVLSQSLEWTCLYLFKPRDKRQRQARSHVRGLQLLYFSSAAISQWPLGRARLFTLCEVKSTARGKGPARHSERSLRSEVRFSIARFLCDESLFDFKFQVYWILLVVVRSTFRIPITSQFVPDLSGPPVPAAASALPANYPVSPPAAHSSPCTSVRIPYACSIPDAAFRPYILAAESPDIPAAGNTSAPAHSRKCTGSGNQPGTSNRALSPWPRCAETR